MNSTTMNIPAQAQAKFREGLALHQQGQLAPAQALYEQVLQLIPTHFDALYLSGVLAAESNNPEGALVMFDKAIDSVPTHVNAHIDRGMVLCKLGRHGPALQNFEKALTLAPTNSEAYYGLGSAHMQMEEHETALQYFDRALALAPNYPEAHGDRGAVLQSLGRLDEALQSIERAIALAPTVEVNHYNRGFVLSALGRNDEAMASYDKAIELKPDYATAYNNRGNLNWTLTRHRAAIEDFDAALSIKPDLPDLFGMRLHMKMAVCDWPALEAQKKLLVEKIDRGERAASPFAAMAALDTLDMQRKCAQIWLKSKRVAGAALGSLRKPPRHKRIRVAYVSSEFRESPAAYNMVGLFENHDRTRFETIAISAGPDNPGEMRSRLKRAFDVFVDAGKKSDIAIAALMREMEIDIAVDSMGPTGDDRTGIFIARGAPIQVNHFGFASGASHFEYIVADPIAIPPDHRAYYLEKMASLPHTLFATDRERRIAERTPTRAEAGLPEDGFVFCSFNNSYKITPEVFDVWMRLLNKVPGSVLWLRGTNSLMPGNLREEAHKRGIDPARLVFAPIAPKMEDHLARLCLADLFVDCFAFNAQTTASDALWAGVPVLTCLGPTMVSRVAGGLLNAIDMPELITRTHDQYEALAFSLATEPRRLAQIRAKLAENRLCKPLFDTPLFTRHLENAYTQMYERYQADLPIEDIQVRA